MVSPPEQESSTSNVVQTVLVVDDEPDIRDVLEAALEAYIDGIEVVTAPSGPEALKILQSRNVDIILTDYRMPGMSGIDFLAAARRLVPNVPRVLMTAYPDIQVAVRAINEEHVASFIPKPLKRAEIVEVISGLLQERRSQTMRSRAFATAMDSMNRELQDLRAKREE